MTNTEISAEKAAAVAAQGAHVAPKDASSKKGPSRKNGAPKGQRAAKGGKSKATAQKKQAKAGTTAAKPTPAKEGRKPRAESKGAMITAAPGKRRNVGSAYGSHRLAGAQRRGFISTAGKKPGPTIESSKKEAGERVYKAK